ncbi:MAG: sigma-70 family RNA polymerase sigma factor [Planctomycetes bacterium]|nr:sigma-70 family RNA polymerase sigma factor [Planctomycetota bacterium]
MLRVRDDDMQAYSLLVERFQQRVVNIVFRYTGDRAGAEDLAQEVFIKVFKARQSYQPVAKFSTWLFRIATNLCLNEIRNRKHRPNLSLDDNPLLDPGQADPTELETSRQELVQAVRKALDALPENQRMAVVLNKWEDQSYEQIAEAMGLSVQAVKSLLFRARAAMKEGLEEFLSPD